MIDIDKLLELETKAIAAPWEFPRYYNCLENPDTLLRVAVFAGLQGSRLSSEGELIVAMRNNIRPLLLELKAARNIVENLRLFFCSNHEEIIDQTCAVCLNSPNGETCAEALLNKIQEYDEVTNGNA